MKNQFVNCFESRLPLIGLESVDDERADQMLAEALADFKGDVWSFDAARGGVDEATQQPLGEENPFSEASSRPVSERLAAFLDRVITDCRPVSAVLILRDVGTLLAEPEIAARLKVIARMTESAAEKDEDYRVQVVVRAQEVKLGADLSSLGTVLTVPVLDETSLAELVRAFAAHHELELEPTFVTAVAAALKGLSSRSAKQLLECAYNRAGHAFPPEVVTELHTEKARQIGRGGMLEIVPAEASDARIGGMLNLKGYLTHVSRLWKNREEAVAFGVDQPRGILIAGMPGCGKSLAAKEAAALFGVPLLRLDTGRLMGKYVGESEHNLRAALATAEAVAPCVLWIDEIEKAFAGVGGASDGGVSTRLFGYFLTWMNEKKSSVYTVATANDISGLPPELLRRGRFDELFSVELPTRDECRQILELQLARRQQTLPTIDLTDEAEHLAQRGASGADVESVVKTAVELAFSRRMRAKANGDPQWNTIRLERADFADARKLIHTTAETMGPKIVELRQRLKEFQMTPTNSGAPVAPRPQTSPSIHPTTASGVDPFAAF